MLRGTESGTADSGYQHANVARRRRQALAIPFGAPLQLLCQCRAGQLRRTPHDNVERRLSGCFKRPETPELFALLSGFGLTFYLGTDTGKRTSSSSTS
jgi:hypothetical protein